MKNHDPDAPIGASRRGPMPDLPGGPAPADEATLDAVVARRPAAQRSALDLGVPPGASPTSGPSPIPSSSTRTTP